MVTNTETAIQFALSLKPNIVRYLFSRHMLVSMEDAEDMAMNAILGFAQRYDSSLGFAPKTYLYNCVKNEFSTWRRANMPKEGDPTVKRKQHKFNTSSIQHIEAATGCDLASPVEEFGFGEVENRALLRGVLQVLTANEKEVLKCALLGMTAYETSTATKISKAYVRVVKDRLREKLAEHLDVDISNTKYAKRQANKLSRKRAA